MERKKNGLDAQMRIQRRRRALVLTAMVALTLLSVGASCFAGVADVSPSRLLATILPCGTAEPLTSTELTVLTRLRLPRIVMALLGGMGLGVSGLIMQAITGNSMASPFTTGLSNAAAMGAAVVIVFELRFMGSMQLSTVCGAFVMALICSALVYGIASAKGFGNTTIVLVGIALNYFFSALNSGMQYIANEDKLTSIVNWTFGSLSSSTWAQIGVVGAVLLLTLPWLFSRAWHYNLLSTGDESALALGVNVRMLRLISGMMVTLIASSIISFTGVIGFVGLVAPHIARLLVGGDHRTLFPLTALVGGALLVLADLAGRTIASPVVIPVGIVVSFIGVPVFLYLILRERKERLK